MCASSCRYLREKIGNWYSFLGLCMKYSLDRNSNHYHHPDPHTSHFLLMKECWYTQRVDFTVNSRQQAQQFRFQKST